MKIIGKGYIAFHEPSEAELVTGEARPPLGTSAVKPLPLAQEKEVLSFGTSKEEICSWHVGRWIVLSQIYYFLLKHFLFQPQQRPLGSTTIQCKWQSHNNETINYQVII